MNSKHQTIVISLFTAVLVVVAVLIYSSLHKESETLTETNEFELQVQSSQSSKLDSEEVSQKNVTQDDLRHLDWKVGEIYEGMKLEEIRPQSLFFTGSKIISGTINDERASEAYPWVHVVLDKDIDLPVFYRSANGAGLNSVCVKNDEIIPDTYDAKRVEAMISSLDLMTAEGGFCNGVVVTSLKSL